MTELSAEDLFEDAPCGYLMTRADGTILRVNRTFETWTGQRREDLLGRRLQDILAPGDRIYYETHISPLLHMQDSIREIAVEFKRADGTRMPSLINATLDRAADLVRTTVFDATDRRRYEQELMAARKREQSIAHELQRGLLTGALPEADRLEIHVAYRPAVPGLEVGGDWYDAFWVEPGTTLALAVGDVVGRGIVAAATMGQLRSAVRAISATGLGPAGVLVALDRYCERHDTGRMATLVYAELDLADATLRYACAGHPPPVVVPPEGPPRPLWEGRSPPLAVGVLERAQATEVLEPGSGLVMYSDGLIERRDRPLTDGIDALIDAVAADREASLADLLPDLVASLPDTAHVDDVCLVAARLLAPALHEGRERLAHSVDRAW